MLIGCQLNEDSEPKPQIEHRTYNTLFFFSQNVPVALHISKNKGKDKYDLETVKLKLKGHFFFFF